jgi:hypothetical protein
MSDYIKSEIINGYTVNVSYDPFPDSPRNWDNLGTIYMEKMRNWNLGDYIMPESYTDEEGEDWTISDEETFKAWFAFETGKEPTVVLPIYVYEHSGIVLRTRQTTPAGRISGYIVATEDKLLAEYGKVDAETIKTATERLSDEVDLYSKYVSGEVYYSEVKDGEEVVDSGGGYFDLDEAFGVGTATAERLSESEPKMIDEALGKLSWYPFGTGGGCDAYRLDNPNNNGLYYLMTKKHESNKPERLDDIVWIMLYNENDESELYAETGIEIGCKVRDIMDGTITINFYKF